MKKSYIIFSFLLLNAMFFARVRAENVEIKHCEFAVSNDSSYPQIFISSNQNLTSLVSRQIFKGGKNAKKAVNSKGAKPVIIVANEFYIFVPSKIDGQYIRLYKVRALDCNSSPKKFKLRFSQIINNVVDPRIEVINLQHNINVQARKSGISKRGKTMSKVIDTHTSQIKGERGVYEKNMPSQPEYEVRPGGYDMYIP